MSGGLTAAILGHVLGALRNLNTLVKLTLKATVLGCWLIPPFQSSSLLPLDGATDSSVQLTSMPPVFLKQHHPFLLASHPLSRPVVQGWKCDSVWPIRILTCPGHCDWFRSWLHDPSQSNQNQCLDGPGGALFNDGCEGGAWWCWQPSCHPEGSANKTKIRFR